MNILDIEVPLIAAVNGPVRLHSEYILLADIVTPTTVFQDKPHFELGVASGDGVHLLWQEAIGSIRGRYFIMTRQGTSKWRWEYAGGAPASRSAHGSSMGNCEILRSHRGEIGLVAPAHRNKAAEARHHKRGSERAKRFARGRIKR
jgi:hypothetical protein